MIRHDYVRQLDRELRRLNSVPEWAVVAISAVVLLGFFACLWFVGGAPNS